MLDTSSLTWHTTDGKTTARRRQDGKTARRTARRHRRHRRQDGTDGKTARRHRRRPPSGDARHVSQVICDSRKRGSRHVRMSTTSSTSQGNVNAMPSLNRTSVPSLNRQSADACPRFRELLRAAGPAACATACEACHGDGRPLALHLLSPGHPPQSEGSGGRHDGLPC